MKKKIITTGLWVGIFMATVIVAYAITTLFLAKSQTTGLSKKKIFKFNLNTNLVSGEVGPGDSFSVSPVIYNDATEDMYVFIQIDMPTLENASIYSFDVDSDWCVVYEENGKVVYAYGNSDMTVLSPGDSTTALTRHMIMKKISNAEYAAIDDINITITGYAIGTEGVSTLPIDAWNECKVIGEIE